MVKDQLFEQIHAYGQWKLRVAQVFEKYRDWLEKNKFNNPETDLRLMDLMETLQTDKISVAFVAEFSRGKSELINAIFFAGYKRRLLPSEAGRTTMCPTELFYDDKAKDSYIRLLPIETRLEETSVADYKKAPENWTQIPLDVKSAEKMAEAFREVIKVKTVTYADAQKLGLVIDEAEDDAANNDPGRPVEIPAWRHAMVSFPHPLLKDGLVVLDTPGLNALGNEPELTINMLPNAQAVLFILGADTGLTKSDLEMWQNHIMSSRSSQTKGLLVVLNKIDTLWDELKGAAACEKIIMDQCASTARTLKLDPKLVLPVSAQKGLLAKVKGDTKLLEQSKLMALENILSNDIIPQKQAIMKDNVIAEVQSMMERNSNVLNTRLEANRVQLDELRALSSENAEVLIHMMEKSREEHNMYKKRVENFQASRKILSVQLKTMLEYMSLENFDKLINKTRSELSGSWTTMGLKAGMKTFFDGIDQIMAEISAQSDQSYKMVGAIYKKFQEEHKMNVRQPKLFTIEKFKSELARLHKEGEAFRNSSKTAMTEQSFVIKRFFISLVSRARDIFYKLHKDAEDWSKTILGPLAEQFKEQKRVLEEKLNNLKNINQSRETVESKIGELEQEDHLIQSKLYEVMKLRDALSGGQQKKAAKSA